MGLVSDHTIVGIPLGIFNITEYGTEGVFIDCAALTHCLEWGILSICKGDALICT